MIMMMAAGERIRKKREWASPAEAGNPGKAKGEKGREGTWSGGVSVR